MNTTRFINEMELEIIVTFNKREQEFYNMNTNPDHFKTPEDLFTHIKNWGFTEEELNDMVKISCCTNIEAYLLPRWYMEENGKLWIEHGELTD